MAKRRTKKGTVPAVEADIPRGQIRWLVDRYHVGTPDAEIAADIRKRIGGGAGWTEAKIEEAVAFAVEVHHENQKLYGQVQSGHFTEENPRRELKRIGVAFAKPRGPTHRRDEYGLYAFEGSQPQYAKYEGYREMRADGEAQVGLPFAGPGAVHLQPLIDFDRSHFDEVRIFAPGPGPRPPRVSGHALQAAVLAMPPPGAPRRVTLEQDDEPSSRVVIDLLGEGKTPSMRFWRGAYVSGWAPSYPRPAPGTIALYDQARWKIVSTENPAPATFAEGHQRALSRLLSGPGSGDIGADYTRIREAGVFHERAVSALAHRYRMPAAQVEAAVAAHRASCDASRANPPGINLDPALLYGRSAESEAKLGAAFKWLTRIGAGRHFPGTPIGWYQSHQINALDILHERAKARAPGAVEFRSRKGEIDAKDPQTGKWVYLGVSGRQVFDEADRRTRSPRTTENPPPAREQLDTFTRAYISAAFFTSTVGEGEPMDKSYTSADLAPETRARMIADAERFQEENNDDLVEGSAEQAGRDFWYTRNGHGAGFWDGGWPEPEATRLTDAAHAFGQYDLLVGDDGEVYGYPPEKGTPTPKGLRRSLGRDKPTGMNPPAAGPVDQAAEDELELYMENTGELYAQKLAIVKNLQHRIAKGTYDPKKTPALWGYWVEAGAKRYAREYSSGQDWHVMFPKNLRDELAKEIAEQEHGKITRGEYGSAENPVTEDEIDRAARMITHGLSVEETERAMVAEGTDPEDAFLAAHAAEALV
jgi:hypothetical protein